MNVDLTKIIREITNDIVREAREIMSSDVGINEKVGKNTLVDSNLYKMIKSEFVQNSDNIVINVFFNHYIEYIERGRKPKEGEEPTRKKQKGKVKITKQEKRIFEIVKWLRRKKIVSSNENILSVAYAINYAIWRDGYKARKILETLDKYVDSGFENKYADMIFDALMKEVDDYFGD